MGILLETIIKEFRKSIVNHREETLFDYVNLFLEYINGAEYVKNISDKELIETLISSLIQVLKNSLDNIVSEALNDPEFEKKSVQEQSSLLLNRSEKNVTQVLVRILSKLQRQKINLSGVEDTKKNIDIILPIISEKELNKVFCPGGSENFRKFMQIVLLSLQRDFLLKEFVEYSKLIFFGF